MTTKKKFILSEVDLHVKARVFAHAVELGLKSVGELEQLDSFKSYLKVMDSKIASE